eukprot:6128182-Pyramimonas_sp.AAC.1
MPRCAREHGQRTGSNINVKSDGGVGVRVGARTAHGNSHAYCRARAVPKFPGKPFCECACFERKPATSVVHSS